MSNQTSESKPSYVIGGSFIMEKTDYEAVVTPEDWNEDQRMFADTTTQFVQADILPHDEEIEKLNYSLTRSLLKKAGSIGLLGADVPDAYGGLGLDKVSSTIISEKLSKASSFALSVGAHVGIGTLPIVYFGSPEQKERYLPDLVTGDKIAAYCLTEPSSGSDALGAKATAVLSPDGKHYILNGTKQFITNGGFADIFIVYAKIDGEQFSTFIVERTMEGVSIGAEEKKMGIKGSSTCSVILEDAKIPVDNLLWEAGKGHLIAFNILNIGRFKLAAGCLGGAKETIELTSAYANVREQFGRPISTFPLIRQKLADMNIRTYILESMVYRTAGLIDQRLSGIDLNDPNSGVHAAKAIAEYALECSINKVFGSEALDFTADEGVQIHGGYGYIQEYKIERIYRDARINRIFEGTNEINRMLIPGTLIKRAMKGELPLMQKIQSLQSELLSIVPNQLFHKPLEEEAHLVSMAKNIFLVLGGLAVQRYQLQLEDEQEQLAQLADILIEIYAMESALLRTQKRIAHQGEEKTTAALHMTQIYIHEAFSRIETLAKTSLAAMETGDTLRTQLSMLRKLTRRNSINTIALKREIAERIVHAEKYII